MAVYTLPELPYDYAALEPHISGRIMELHHDRHHAAYVTGANAALEKLQAAASGTDNVLWPMREAHAVGATGGEVSDALRAVWGKYTPRDAF